MVVLQLRHLGPDVPELVLESVDPVGGVQQVVVLLLQPENDQFLFIHEQSQRNEAAREVGLWWINDCQVPTQLSFPSRITSFHSMIKY